MIEGTLGRRYKIAGTELGVCTQNEFVSQELFWRKAVRDRNRLTMLSQCPAPAPRTL